jgi:hypothetical protein
MEGRLNTPVVHSHKNNHDAESKDRHRENRVTTRPDGLLAASG